MTLTVRPITAQEHLAFIDAPAQQRSVSFLQTPAWGRVKTEWRSESVGWFREGTEAPVGAALVLHRPVPKLRRYTLAYLPEGPVLPDEAYDGRLADWLGPLAAYLRANGAFGIRIGPPVATARWSADQIKAGIADDAVGRLTELAPASRPARGARVVSQLRELGWLLQSPEDGFGAGQPQYTYEVPLVDRETLDADGAATPLTEEQVLKRMNQLWRRNIKRADKEGVEVRVSLDPADLADFHALYVHTAERDGFTPRGLRYFQVMFEALSAECNADGGPRIKLFLARHEGDLVAATILVRVGAHAWYSYGASSTEKREVRGSNALQWAMIRDALDSGCDVYDLRGITPTLASDDSHVGLIQFKVGTGGEAVEYVGEWDLPLRRTLYKAFDLYMKRRGR